MRYNYASLIGRLFLRKEEKTFSTHRTERYKTVEIGVARWFVFKPKIPILMKFGGPWNIKYCYIFGHLEYITAIWYNLQPFAIVCGHLVNVFFRFGMFGPRKIWQPWWKCD
jgi:hypothetical protein